jgi:hypothetical protein
VLAVLGVAYTHYIGIFVLAAQVGWAFWVHRDRLRELVTVHALIVLAAALVAAGVRAWRRDAPGARTVLVILLAVATPLGIAALSLPGDRSFLLPRNLIASLPALAVLIGWLLVALRSRLAVAATAAFLLVLAVGAAQALDSGHRRSPYRDAAHVVDARARPGDPVIQRYFLPLEGSLATGLRVNFARPHPLHFAGGESEAAAWERGRRTGRVYMVVPLPRVFKGVRHAERLAGAEQEFERRHTGLEDILVAEYALRDGAPGS